MGSETVESIIADMGRRAEVASRQDADAMLHHSAVADMLKEFVARLRIAQERAAAERKHLEEALHPVLECKWTLLASQHGTEAGDDPEFDKLCDVVWMAQRKMKGE